MDILIAQKVDYLMSYVKLVLMFQIIP
jgi:hypothetical protein